MAPHTTDRKARKQTRKTTRATEDPAPTTQQRNDRERQGSAPNKDRQTKAGVGERRVTTENLQDLAKEYYVAFISGAEPLSDHEGKGSSLSVHDASDDDLKRCRRGEQGPQLSFQSLFETGFDVLLGKVVWHPKA